MSDNTILRNNVYVNGGTTYVVMSDDDNINIDSSLGATIVYLPNINNEANFSRRIYINDIGGQAGTNNITLKPSGANLINGESEFILSADGVSAEILIANNTEYLVNFSDDSMGPSVVAWGGITGNPVNQTDLQSGTIQGVFTPDNSAIASNDTFKVAFEKAQGQISGLNGSFISLVNTNYIFVIPTNNAIINGTNLIAGLQAAKNLTPNGSALSSTNRAVLYSFNATWNLGLGSLDLGEFVDIIFLGDAESNIITSTNSTGTIQIANSNDYILKNMTVSNTGSGGSIVHNASQADNGQWENLILNAKNTEGTIFAGSYKNITGVVDEVLNGNITGTVEFGSFQNKSCGYGNTISITVSGTIKNSMGLSKCFGSSESGDVIISSTNILDNEGASYCFGASVSGNSSISGYIKNSKGTDHCFSYGVINEISGTLENCKATTFSIGSTTLLAQIIGCERTESYGFHSGTFTNCKFSATLTSCILITGTATVRYSILYQTAGGSVIDGGFNDNIIWYMCSANADINGANLNNLVSPNGNIINSLIVL